jgi:hypothetical protein
LTTALFKKVHIRADFQSARLGNGPYKKIIVKGTIFNQKMNKKKKSWWVRLFEKIAKAQMKSGSSGCKS